MMSDEEITYTTVRFHKSSSVLQNRGRPDETQGLRKSGHRECSVPCHFIAKALGILSAILLVAVAVLVIHSKHVEVQWFCCGIKCYFIMNKKNWKGCQQTCQDCSFSILKIDDDDELKFLQLQINPSSYWTGLSYETKKRKWQWIDDSPLKLSGDQAQLSNARQVLTTQPNPQKLLSLTCNLLKVKIYVLIELICLVDSPWRMTAVVLGTVCLCLLMSNAVLGYLFLQSTSNFKFQYGKDANANTVSSMEVTGPSTLHPFVMGKGYHPCHGKWSCCGENCYYFSEEEKTWEDSEASCRRLGSHLAKIDNREEQNFIQSRLNYSYWVGLHKNGNQFQWVNQKDRALSSDLYFRETHSASADCGYLKPVFLSNGVCSRYFHYICEKNFTCLVNSKSR
ncbi:C-type lectin domain family 7 member A-like protein [Cricetulus griseus]|uniref:C-type lectin domain family 7 member A-like protein n=1 Tax=Cricetulus griseus TaxID=10029 RepID=A0A061I250_CRIGR|nr:C-type lectin domain family 7 member A-like protein [Cricetulus griseus]